MKRHIVMLASLLMGCDEGGDAGEMDNETCAAGVVGTWLGVTVDDRIEISADGSFRYSGVDGCTSTGSFVCPESTMTSGSMQVFIDTSGGGSCLSAGGYICTYVLTGDSMAYDCTRGGSLEYTRE